MPNFYKDNDDIQFHIKNIDLDWIIELKENNFKDKGKFDYAPKNLADAKDSFDRILDIIGDISGNVIEPLAAEIDAEGSHFENGQVKYAKGIEIALEALRKADMMGFTLPRRFGG